VDPQSELDACQKKLQEKDTQYRYLYADLENFKKRAAQERAELMRFASEPMAMDLLDITDSLERAIGYASEKSDKNLVEGLELTLRQVKNALERHGIQRLQPMGQQFNPDVHESTGFAPSEQAKGTVVAEQSPGYTLHKRLLRPARVLISSGKSEHEAA
jgi:molecular chaperone GrpE